MHACMCLCVCINKINLTFKGAEGGGGFAVGAMAGETLVRSFHS